MTKIKPETKIQPKIEQVTTKSVANESVQVGVSNLKYGHGHYMFDPSKGQLISKCLFSVSKSTKKSLKFL